MVRESFQFIVFMIPYIGIAIVALYVVATVLNVLKNKGGKVYTSYLALEECTLKVGDVVFFYLPHEDIFKMKICRKWVVRLYHKNELLRDGEFREVESGALLDKLGIGEHYDFCRNYYECLSKESYDSVNRVVVRYWPRPIFKNAYGFSKMVREVMKLCVKRCNENVDVT